MRRCDRCKTALHSRKGHGFVSKDGRTVLCGRRSKYNVLTGERLRGTACE